MSRMTLLQAMADPNLFASWFRNRKTWGSWFVFLRALIELPMTSDQFKLYQRCTGRNSPPAKVASEAWLVICRRGGKSFILALVAVFLACFHSYRQFLAPGEKGTILIIATDRKQGRVIFRYIRGLLTQVPMLQKMIERETADTFELDTGIIIEVGTASFRSTRGYTLVAVLCDEIAFWPTDDAAEPDYERRGALWDAHKRHFAQDGDPILVWQADTRTMNPTVPQILIDEANARDPASAHAEYGAQFRSDIESFVSREAVEACITPAVRERPPLPNVRYFAFTDPSGGTSDSFTLAIGHRQETTAVLDAVREVKPPFSPESVVAEFAGLLKYYRINAVTGDRYAGEWPREQFRKLGIQYELSQKPKSDLYRDFLPLVNSRQVDLLDLPRAIAQLISLERRTARGGRDSIDHPPGTHDDIANAIAGLVVRTGGKPAYDSSLAWVGNGDVNISDCRQREFMRYVASGGQRRP